MDTEISNSTPSAITQKMKYLWVHRTIRTGLLCWKLQNAGEKIEDLKKY